MALPTAPWDSHVGTITTLAEEATFLSDLAASTDRVRLINLGTSAQGRPIRAVIVGPARTRDQIRASNVVMILGSHHGDEWAGREATFTHMLDHAAGTGTETIVYLPTVSPDSVNTPDRELANGVDPNRLWSNSGIAQQTDGTAYEPEQLALREAILLYHPRLILDTHEYGASANSTSGIYRFDPGTINATGTPSAVISIAQAVIGAMKTAATDAGYTIADYIGNIPDDGGTQAWKRGGIPAVFTESPQDATGGITLRRAQQLGSLNVFQSYSRANSSTLASAASSATWYSGIAPTLSDPYDPSADTGIRLVGATSHGSPSGTTTVNIVRPAGTQPGDLLLLHSANASNTVPSTPSGGWLEWETPVGYGPSLVSFYKWASDNDPAVWAWPVPSSKTSLTVEAWRGVDPDNPKDVAAKRSALETSYPAAPSITTVTDGAVVITAGGTIGPSGDLDLRWTTDGTENARATSQLSGTTNSGTVTVSRRVATAGTVSPTLSVIETVSRGGTLVSALRPATYVPPEEPPTDTVALSGSGTLTAAATRRVTLSAAASGSGTLTSAATARRSVSGALSGTGTLAATISAVRRTVSGTASGSGQLTASTAQDGETTADFFGSGSLSATTARRVTVSASFTGAGSATAQTSAVLSKSAALSGSGTLTATTGSSSSLAAALTGSGSLTATTSSARTIAAAITGSGKLTASLPAPTFAEVSVTLTGSGRLSASASGRQTAWILRARRVLHVGEGSAVVRAYNVGDIIPGEVADRFALTDNDYEVSQTEVSTDT